MAIDMEQLLNFRRGSPGRVIQAPAGSGSIPQGGSRASSLGQSSGALLAAFLRDRKAAEGERIEERKQAEALQADVERWNPIAAAFQEKTGLPITGEVLARNPDLGETLSRTFATEAMKPAPGPEPFTRVLPADDPLNARLNLGIPEGSSARVEMRRMPDGSLQGSVVERPFAPDEGEGGGADFGRGASGRALSNITELAPIIEAGEATDEQRRLWESSVTEYTQPRRQFDPVTERMIDINPVLPEFARRAMGAASGDAAPTTGAPSAPRASGYQTLPEDLQIPEPEEVTAEFGASGQPTIYELVQEGNTTGPIPALMRAASGIPGLGIRADEENTAADIVTGMTRQLASALRQNPRFVEGERAELVEDFSVEPAVLDTPQKMASKLISVAQILESREREAQEVVSGDRPLVTGETRGMAMDSLRSIQNARRWLVPPLIRDEEAYNEWRKTARPGQAVLVPDSEGNWDFFVYDPEE